MPVVTPVPAFRPRGVLDTCAAGELFEYTPRGVLAVPPVVRNYKMWLKSMLPMSLIELPIWSCKRSWICLQKVASSNTRQPI